MNTELFFDFVVDNAAQTVKITREFDATQELVWEAFTNKELLDQWNAPDPYKAETKYLDFTVGGKRFYAMVGPSGQKSWILQEYLQISPITHFKLYNAFADEQENASKPGSEWDFSFSSQGDMTKVEITIYNESFERMASLMDGFKAGYTATLEKLDNLLADLKKKLGR